MPTSANSVGSSLEPHVEQWRAMGVFGPAIEPPAGADAQARLLCLAGRQP